MPKRGRLKRFLGTALLAGSLALGACDRAAVGEFCRRPTNAEEFGCINLTAQIYQRGSQEIYRSLTFTEDGLTFYFEGFERDGDAWKAIVTIEDGGCHTIASDKIGGGESKIFAFGERSYELTMVDMGGQTPDINWVRIHISPPGCDESCRPAWECGYDYIYRFDVEEGTTGGFVDFLIRINGITEDVGAAPDGETCPISNVKVDLTITYPGGQSETLVLGEDECTMEDCHSVRLDSVTMDVSPASGGTCTVSNETAVIEVGYPPEDSQ